MTEVTTLCIGNCQSRDLQKVLFRLGEQARFFLFPAPLLGEWVSLDETKKWLAPFFHGDGLRDALTMGLLRLVPSLGDLRRFSPQRVVINLMHEYPYWVGKPHGKPMALTSPSLDRLSSMAPSLSEALDTSFAFNSISEDGSYFDRFDAFTCGLRSVFPDAHFILYKRLSQSKRYGAVLSSDLRPWENCWRQGREQVENLAHKLGNASILDLDELAAHELCHSQNLDVVASRQIHVSFPAQVMVRIVRDIEHPSAVLTQRAAEYVLGLSKQEPSVHERQILAQIRADEAVESSFISGLHISREVVGDGALLTALVAEYLTTDCFVDWEGLISHCHDIPLVVRNLSTIQALVLAKRGPSARELLHCLLARLGSADQQLKHVRRGRFILEETCRLFDLLETDFAMFDSATVFLCCAEDDAERIRDYMKKRGVPIVRDEVLQDCEEEAVLQSERLVSEMDAASILIGSRVSPGPQRIVSRELLQAILWAEDSVRYEF